MLEEGNEQNIIGVLINLYFEAMANYLDCDDDNDDDNDDDDVYANKSVF